MQPIVNYFQPSNTRCLLIAEVAQTHDGSLGLAHAFIDAAAKAGADAIKFQTHIAAAESTLRESFRIKFSTQDDSRYAYWKRMEFTEEQWHGLAVHAREKKLHFLSSPFSLEAAELLKQVGMEAWKIASGEISNIPMLKWIAATKQPMILSTGLATWADIDEAAALLKNSKIPLALLQTTTRYPTPPEEVGLNLISDLRKRYSCIVGISDHSGTIFPGLASYMLGGRIVEVHLSLSRDMFGPDVSSSVTAEELTMLANGLRFFEQAVNNPVDKNVAMEKISPLRELFGKSVVARQRLETGSVLGPENITLKKPGGGIPPREIDRLYGCTLGRVVEADEAISYQDIAVKKSAT